MKRSSFLPTMLAALAPFAAMAQGAESPADFVLQKDKAGLVHLGASRKALQEDTYDQSWMKSEFMDRHVNVVEISLPGDLQARTSRRPLASLVVHLQGNLRDGGTVSTVDVRDPRFRTAEGLGPASTLGDIRALHPDLVIRHEVIHENSAEVHHPNTMINGVTFRLRPADYLKYRPSDGLPDNTPVYFVRISVYSTP